MKALKGFLIYVGIVLVIILLIFGLLFGIMYFAPNVRIFGIGVVHKSGKVEESTIDLSLFSYSNIELNVSSGDISLNIIPTAELENIEYNMNLSTFGIATDITEYSVIKKVEVEESVLKVNLNVTEPSGWISEGGSNLNIYIPAEKDYDMMLTTDSANIYLGNKDTSFVMNSLNVNTGSGNMLLTNIGTGEEIRNLNLESMNIITKSGTMNFSAIDNIVVNNKIQLNADNGELVFKNLYGSIDVHGTGIKLVADNIVCGSKGFTFICDNGVFDLGTLSSPAVAENVILTENCNVRIKEITGKTTIVTTYGHIEVNIFSDVCNLESEHGNIVVGKARNNITAITYFGNITVDEYLKNGVFTSNKGNIIARSTSEYEYGVYTEITNNDGEVYLKNKINQVLVTTNGNSKTTVVFEEIKTGLAEELLHKVSVKNSGSALVYLPAIITTPFKFVARGEISGEIAGLVPEYGGDKVQSRENYQYYPTVESQEEANSNSSFLFEGKIRFSGYTNISQV